MEKIYEDRILKELDSLKEVLLEYEQLTIEMISCDIDEIEPHSEGRMSLTKKMDKVFDRILQKSHLMRRRYISRRRR